jgi:hypothetical protein
MGCGFAEVESCAIDFLVAAKPASAQRSRVGAGHSQRVERPSGSKAE